MDVAFPFHYDGSGRTAAAGYEDHIRDLIEQVLFTNPGERVNRPNFGSGLGQLLFAPNSPELATAVQFLVQGALQQWLGDLIGVEQVRVDALESALQVRVDYIILRTQERDSAQFSQET
jgi:uncharacterized protein